MYLKQRKNILLLLYIITSCLACAKTKPNQKYVRNIYYLENYLKLEITKKRWKNDKIMINQS